MVVKILKIVQWAISRKPKKLHILNLNKKQKKIFIKKKKEKNNKQKWKLQNYKITPFSLKLKV
jgi:hypothetical protein